MAGPAPGREAPVPRCIWRRPGGDISVQFGRPDMATQARQRCRGLCRDALVDVINQDQHRATPPDFPSQYHYPPTNRPEEPPNLAIASQPSTEVRELRHTPSATGMASHNQRERTPDRAAATRAKTQPRRLSVRTRPGPSRSLECATSHLRGGQNYGQTRLAPKIPSGRSVAYVDRNWPPSESPHGCDHRCYQRHCCAPRRPSSPPTAAQTSTGCPTLAPSGPSPPASPGPLRRPYGDAGYP